MLSIGIDIGTTSLCAVVIETESRKIVDYEVRNNDSFITSTYPWERKQLPEKIMGHVNDMLSVLLKRHNDIASIGVTGQMHGILYTDKDNNVVSPLFTWQDARGQQIYRDGNTYAEHISMVTGYKVAPGYGLVTHFYNVVNNLVPQEAIRIYTIMDYVAMKLCKKAESIMHQSNAASLGLYDLGKGCFDSDALVKIGLKPDILLDIVSGNKTVGTTNKGIPVSVAIGDNQASFIGSVDSPESSILVNIGTGSQISVMGKLDAANGEIEARPYIGKSFLLVGSSLCGGRAFATLERFFSGVAKMMGEEHKSMYPYMDRVLEQLETPKDIWEVSTQLDGTREDPLVRGYIKNLSLDNFTPEHMMDGFLRGIANELCNMYKLIMPYEENRRTKLVGSGNGVRKNKYFQKVLEEIFSLPLTIPEHSEEAAFGAALFSISEIF